MLLALHILLDLVRAGGVRSDHADLLHVDHRRSGAVHRYRGRPDLGGAFQRHDRPAGHVARLLALHYALCGAGAGAGANLGSAINPVFEGGQRDNPASYRLPVGNLINRLVGIARWWCRSCRPIDRRRCSALQPDLGKTDRAVSHRVQCRARHHLHRPARSAGLAADQAVPDAARVPTDPYAPRYLDESALETPSLALTDAARETLRMGDLVEVMLRKSCGADDQTIATLVGEVSRIDNVVDHLDECDQALCHQADPRAASTSATGQRAMEIISFAINLEH